MDKELTNHERMTQIVNQLAQEDLAALQSIEPEQLTEDGTYAPKITPEMGIANKHRDINNTLSY